MLGRSEEQEKMRAVNDPERRKEAKSIHDTLTKDKNRPVSKSSVAGLEQKQREDDKNDQAITACIMEDTLMEDAFEKKTVDSLSKARSLIRKTLVLDNKLAATNLQSILFKKLPSDILVQKVLPCIEDDLKTLARLTQTCKRLSPFFQPPLNRKKLQQYVVYGKKDEVKKILAAASVELLKELLCQREIIVNYSGQSIEATAYQLALGAGDVGREGEQYKDEGIAEMIEDYLLELPDGESEIRKQQTQQFPEGYKEEEKQRKLRDSAALREVIQTIENSTGTDDCESALRTFREHLRPKGVIRYGKHFNRDMLHEVYSLYNEKFWSFGAAPDRKTKLLWRKVIGYMLRFLPACDAQAFCQGIITVVEGEKLKRSMQINHNGDIFFPLDSDPNYRLGYEWCVSASGIVATLPELAGPIRAVAQEYKIYADQKEQRCEAICQKDRVIIKRQRLT